MTKEMVNIVLQRFDLTEPHLQREIVAEFTLRAAQANELRAKAAAVVEAWNRREIAHVNHRRQCVLELLNNIRDLEAHLRDTEPKGEPMSAIDYKYGKITAEKKEFHPGEPVMVFRATDPLAAKAIRYYADLCKDAGCYHAHIQAVYNSVLMMELWQNQHPALVKKKPDTVPDHEKET